MRLFKTVFKDLFTGIDGKTYHMAKFSWVFSMIGYTAVIIYHLSRTDSMDFLALAGGYGLICTTHSAAIFGMKDQEPKECKEQQAHRDC